GAPSSQQFDRARVQQLSEGGEAAGWDDQKEAEFTGEIRLDSEISEGRSSVPVLGHELALDPRGGVELAAVLVPGFLRTGARDVDHAVVGKLEENWPIGVANRTQPRVAHTVTRGLSCSMNEQRAEATGCAAPSNWIESSSSALRAEVAWGADDS